MVIEILFQAALAATALFATIYLLRRYWRRRRQPNPDGPLRVNLPKPAAEERPDPVQAAFDGAVERPGQTERGQRDAAAVRQRPAQERSRLTPPAVLADLNRLKQAVRMLASASRERLDRHDAALASLAAARQTPQAPASTGPQTDTRDRESKTAQQAMSARLDALEATMARINSEASAFPEALDAITARLVTLEDTIARQRDRTVTAAMMPALAPRQTDEIRAAATEQTGPADMSQKDAGTDLWSDLMGMPDGMISLLPLTETGRNSRVQ